MRPLEGLLGGLLVMSAVSLFVRPARRCWWIHLLPSAATVLAIVQLLWEGYRWPMVPLYGVTMALQLVSLARFRSAPSTLSSSATRMARWSKILGFCLTLGALLIGVALPMLFAHLQLPAPTGPYGVGTTNLNFVDDTRPETFTPEESDRRELFARVWYPATPAPTEEPTNYCEQAHEISRALTAGTMLPSFLFDQLALTETSSYRDAPLAADQQRFPVVIFSHAYWGSVSQCTALMQELASHGYIAISLGHPFETPYSIQGDGHIQAYDARNEEFQLRGRERQAAYEATHKLTTTTDRRELETLLREISRLRPKAVESVHIWSDDIRSLIDHLETLDRGPSRFAGRLDLERIVVMGHSFGGAAAGQACLDDPRCKAGINMDGLQLGDMLDHPLTRPFLFIHHDNVNARNRTPNVFFFERALAPAYLLTIEGSGHLSFTDVSFYPPYSIFRLLTPAGTIDGERCHGIVSNYVLAFLQQYLRAEESRLLTGRSQPYPESELASRLPPATPVSLEQ